MGSHADHRVAHPRTFVGRAGALRSAMPFTSRTTFCVGMTLLLGPLFGCFKGGDDTAGTATETGSGTDTGSECPIGSEGCACAPGGACDPGLVCVGSGVCAMDSAESETGEDLCGNGTIDVDEECDDGPDNGDTKACTSACRNAICGDGLVLAGSEDCDTGVQSSTCDSDCTPPACGDGIVNMAAGETCDDGNVDPNDDCTDQCLLATCGDGTVNPGEECDDGNVDPDDDCTPDCKSLWWAKGPQVDIPQANLVGWELCWSGLYGTNSPPLTDILNNSCNKSKLLIACRPVADTNLTLLAMGERSAVTFDTGTGNVPYNHNGVGFYYNGAHSWGFALEGDPIQRNSCDLGEGNNQFRMCWHTWDGSMTGGFRCGEAMWLNADNDWTRMIFQAE
jgi:cysteine-rich repeat protein